MVVGGAPFSIGNQFKKDMIYQIKIINLLIMVFFNEFCFYFYEDLKFNFK